MKKSILIFCTILTAFSIMAFGYMDWSNTGIHHEKKSCNTAFALENDPVINSNKPADINFFYDVDSRYMRTITKKDLHKVRSMAAFLPKEQIESIVSFHSVSVIFLGDNYESIISATGDSFLFNAEQIKLLQSADYSTNILIRAEYQQKNGETGELEESYTTPHLTVVPEKEAAYVSGKDALIEYLKENSKEKTAIVKQDKLQPGKVSFMVTKNGTISNVKLLASSGYPSIDEKMFELITKAPEKWESAENSKGEKVDQTLVFSFGIIGC